MCLIFSENYIRSNFQNIKENENVIECRVDDKYSLDLMIEDNNLAINKCNEFQNDYILIDDKYDVDYKL